MSARGSCGKSVLIAIVRTGSSGWAANEPLRRSCSPLYSSLERVAAADAETHARHVVPALVAGDELRLGRIRHRRNVSPPLSQTVYRACFSSRVAGDVQAAVDVLWADEDPPQVGLTRLSGRHLPEWGRLLGDAFAQISELRGQAREGGLAISFCFAAVRVVLGYVRTHGTTLGQGGHKRDGQPHGS